MAVPQPKQLAPTNLILRSARPLAGRHVLKSMSQAATFRRNSNGELECSVMSDFRRQVEG